MAVQWITSEYTRQYRVYFGFNLIRTIFEYNFIDLCSLNTNPLRCDIGFYRHTISSNLRPRFNVNLWKFNFHKDTSGILLNILAFGCDKWILTTHTRSKSDESRMRKYLEENFPIEYLVFFFLGSHQIDF